MKSQHMEMDEEWAERGRAGEGREAAAASRAGMNGEVERWKGGGVVGGARGEEARDEREGRREGTRTQRRNTRIGEGKRNAEGGMPGSNGLIQALSSMESRACQIACNQQPSPLSAGGMVHGEGKRRINTEWSFCSGRCCAFSLSLPLSFSFEQPVDVTVFT